MPVTVKHNIYIYDCLEYIKAMSMLLLNYRMDFSI